jgi:hypothetical protein
VEASKAIEGIYNLRSKKQYLEVAVVAQEDSEEDKEIEKKEEETVASKEEAVSVAEEEEEVSVEEEEIVIENQKIQKTSISNSMSIGRKVDSKITVILTF